MLPVCELVRHGTCPCAENDDAPPQLSTSAEHPGSAASPKSPCSAASAESPLLTSSAEFLSSAVPSSSEHGSAKHQTWKHILLVKKKTNKQT